MTTTILTAEARTPPKIPPCAPGATGEHVIDESTFRTIEVAKLFDTLNQGTSRIGGAVLYRSLVRPLDNAKAIKSKQEALAEIEASPELREALGALILKAAKREEDFYNLLYGTFLGMMGRPSFELELEGFGYETYISATRFLLGLAEDAEHLPPLKSTYLQQLRGDIAAFSRSRAFQLAQGPVYRSEKDVLTAQEKRWYTPAVKFKPSLFKPVWLLALVGTFMLALEFVPMLLEMSMTIAPVFWLFLAPMALVYIPIVGGFDRDAFIYPIRDVFKRSPELALAVDALGKLDELMNFLHFRDHFGHPVCLPKLTDATQHTAKLSNVRNPILATNNADYVANDIDLKKDRLTFVTGPNSGGKTAFCKTLAQTQLMAQIGCYVPAEKAELSVADRIFYQVPEISQLADGEGRFGTELKRTKEVFVAASGRSLVIMDELSEGTTHEEKIEISTDILNGFSEKGCSTLLITHNHELVEQFQTRHIGHARQVEFKNDQPTYRLIEGISKVSHADRVARKIGFGKDDIEQMLKADRKKPKR